VALNYKKRENPMNPSSLKIPSIVMPVDRLSGKTNPAVELPLVSATSKPKTSRYQIFKRILSLIKPEFPKITIGLIALIINSITNLSFPWIIGKAIDSAGTENLYDFLRVSAPYFLVGSLASWIRIYFLGLATENISNKLKLEFFQALLSQDIEYYESTTLGEIVSLLENDIVSTSELLTEKMASGLRSFNSAVNGSFLLYSVSPQLTTVSLSVIPLVGIAAMTLSRYSRRFTNKLREIHSSIHSYSLERFQNISTVRLNNRENYEKSQFSLLLNESKGIASKRYSTYGGFMSFINLSTNLSLIAVLRVGGLMISSGKLTVGQLTSFAIQVRLFCTFSYSLSYSLVLLLFPCFRFSLVLLV
jgi:ABC-type bacteriocin/lantibiotic exporter with double-glycine peptidase domain